MKLSIIVITLIQKGLLRPSLSGPLLGNKIFVSISFIVAIAVHWLEAINCIPIINYALAAPWLMSHGPQLGTPDPREQLESEIIYLSPRQKWACNTHIKKTHYWRSFCDRKTAKVLSVIASHIYPRSTKIRRY